MNDRNLDPTPRDATAGRRTTKGAWQSARDLAHHAAYLRTADERDGPGHHAAAPARTLNEAAALYNSTSADTALSVARERYQELADRDLIARATARLKARGDPAHCDPAKYPPLNADEHLEAIALGELLARHYRHPVHVHHALTSGASWRQIAEATGRIDVQVRREYKQWADAQHQLWQHYEGRFGMPDTQHQEAMLRASGSADQPQIEAGQ
jgi:hypothetical protein